MAMSGAPAVLRAGSVGSGKPSRLETRIGRFIEEADLHCVEGGLQGHSEDIESTDEIGDGAGALDGDFFMVMN